MFKKIIPFITLALAVAALIVAVCTFRMIDEQMELWSDQMRFNDAATRVMTHNSFGIIQNYGLIVSLDETMESLVPFSLRKSGNGTQSSGD